MKRLFLDDDPVRCSRMVNAWPDTVVCNTAKSCINYLTIEWDIVYLDHDLGDEHMVNSDREDCGMEVIRYIERLHADGRQPLQVKLFVIHTWNIPAGEIMAKALEKLKYNVYRMPFQDKLLEIGKGTL